MSESDLIRSARFHNERKKDWKELEDLLAKVQRGGLGNLSFHQANRLSALYRQAMHSLSLAREISMDRALHEYLESLCTRSYLAVYAPRDTLRELVKRYFTVSAPRAVRKCKWVILLSALFMVLGGVVGFGLTQSDNSWYHSFVPGGLSKGRGPAFTGPIGVLFNHTVCP